MSRLSENTLAEPLEQLLQERMNMSDSKATPECSIGECIHPKIFAHSPDRPDFTGTSSSHLSKVAEVSSRNRISVSSRQPDNEQATSCNGGVTLDSTPSFEHSIGFHLPPELLADIFFGCTQSYRYSSDETDVPRWVGVSYVCQYWRNLALGCAHLWARLFFVSPKWMDELLRRSKTVPLIVDIHPSWTLHDVRAHPLSGEIAGKRQSRPRPSDRVAFPCCGRRN